jgi:hypothetical protein
LVVAEEWKEVAHRLGAIGSSENHGIPELLEGAVDGGFALWDEMAQLVCIDGDSLGKPADSAEEGPEAVVFVVSEDERFDGIKSFCERQDAPITRTSERIGGDRGAETRVRVLVGF